ncbi:protein phosphatase 2C domain-containing protein [Lentzea sp. NEAU-D13]|uniref:Protein phosphatase 2C domain-containing protein n=1 Tax=Lentzea alba TaxID=2714351 RepID=A0A7C9VKD7_9PSEU|nr:protein phosphatase 2C domain-containing protein [Lentzea alba]NGY58094.1 protein phosphatase 2C domain-containing protein [Lentzea alba]
MATPETTPVQPGTEAKWQGYVEPFVVGDPGRAAAGVVPLPDETAWDRKDTVLDAFALRDGRTRLVEVRAASVRGLAHRAYGRVRQDEYGFRRTADGRYLVICVADGVSSGELSHKAAMLVTRWGTKWLTGLLDRTEPADLQWGQFVRGVATQIEKYGRKLLRGREDIDAEKCDLRDVAHKLATTVLYAVVDLRAVDGAHTAHVVTVGDTSAWVLREGGRWEPQEAVKNDGAEVFSASVHALPLPPATDPVPVRTTIRAGEALVLMTDGIGDPLGQGTGPVGRFLADVWARPPASGVEFAAQIGFARKSFDDDRTVVAVWPVSQR